ncbi:MAG: DUF421 domain-containing protein [Chloroflexota bacterium]|nr:DUF421 domain-containing protein [Chloroflexota bacterium]
MLDFGVPWWELIVRAVVVYVVFFAALRILGKRQLGQLAIHDLVFLLLVSNAVQPAVTGPDASLVGGIVIVATLGILNLIVGRLEMLSFFHRLLLPSPTVVIQHGKYLEDALRREQVERDLVDASIREHGLENVNDVEFGVLEVDGTISIVPSGGRTFRTRHRVRAIKR